MNQYGDRNIIELDEMLISQGQHIPVMPRATDEVLTFETKLAIQREGKAAFAAHYAETGAIRNPPTCPYGEKYTQISPGQRNSYQRKNMKAWTWYDAYGCAESELLSGVWKQ